ncbi:MAG TPA: restriction endonuclease subunit S [Prolixibacteraceae bacterium]|nr:restriction endonuclease subunit S [Prolixibacteraceae bacterium]
MLQNWKTYKLRDVLQIKNGKTKPKYEGQYPIYGGNGILGYGNVANLNEEAILIGRVGAYCGAVYYENREIWVSDNSLFGIAKDGFDTKYLFYLLKWADLNRFATGSSQPLLTQGALNVLEYEIPISLPEQHSIASILSALDDKIELNLQMNKTLEEMAMTLYEHWFVDFGPFQSGEFVDSELGMIPKGWEVKRLGDIVDVGSSNRIFLKEYVENGIPFYRGKEIIQLSKGMNISTELFITNERFKEIKNKSGVPLKDDILISSVGTIGVSWLVENNDPFYFKDGNLTWIKNYNERVNGNFISQWLKSNETQEQIKSETIGSTQQALTISALRTLKIILPPNNSSIIQDVSIRFCLWNELLLSNKMEIQTLTTLRDTLLPKLISGEVRVKEAKKILEEAI